MPRREAATQFLHDHPKRVRALLEGLYATVKFLNANAAQAQSIANAAVASITGKKLAGGVVSAAWPHMAFTLDPLASSLKTSADHAYSLGLLKDANLNGLYDLATPYHGAEYEFEHLALEPQIAANIRYTYYPAGHMMYIDPASARQLKDDLAAFYATAQ